MRSIPFIVGVVPLFLLFLFTFLSWYWLMGNLFSNEKFLEGLLVAYSLPVTFTFTAYVGKVRKSIPILHFLSLPFLGILYLIMSVSLTQRKVPLFLPEAIIGIGLVAAVMSIMLYPITELQHYFKYKPVLFIAGVIFMPLFIAIATFGLTVAIPLLHELHQLEESGKLSMEQFFLTATTKLSLPAFVLIGLLIGFWASAAWLGSSKTHGQYVSGLELGEMFAFRPDLILPGGVNLVKGVLLTGMGLILMLHIDPTLPRWNWWGFILAFWGIMFLIPIRGIFKMILRRERLLGNSGVLKNKINFAKESLLFFGLLILLYGFLNAFRAVVPFTVLVPSSEDWPAIIPVVISFIILVPVRMMYKSRLLEGLETRRQLFLKQLLLWVGVVLLIYSFAFAFRTKIHVFTNSLNYANNPLDFSIGIFLFVLGAILMLVVRPLALRNEFRALLRIMPGMLAALSEEKRLVVMYKRLDFLATCPGRQRLEHVKYMMDGLETLPSNLRAIVRKSMIECVARLPDEKRGIIMSTMDKLMFG
ncbi:hypothetical protein HRbin02_00944 [Candidatus Calditenuaceae archaeon HR02]|nr:hypothetical protein HRbin02_00944 [Candidatus Calditenuaceae archaeon HR02]